MTQEQMKQAAHEYFRKGQLGFVPAADTEAAFLAGARFRQMEINELVKTLENLVFLHSCEQEGIGAGMPTPKEWFEAVEIAQNVINKVKRK